MRILGIDPGVATIGFGVIDSDGGTQKMVQYGAIITKAGLPLATRLLQIGDDMEELIRRFEPDEISARISPPVSLWLTAGALFCI